MRQRGLFITLEGGEGVGKTIQSARLAEWLKGLSIQAITTREPGGSPGAEEIRRLLVTGQGDRWDGITEALLLTAARRHHVEKVIRPALAQGIWVVCDRFVDSTMVYQGSARKVDTAVLRSLTQIAIGELRPDLTLILDLPVEAGLLRAQHRAGDETRFEQLDVEFHHNLRQAYRQLAASEPQRCHILDASGSIEQVEAAIHKILTPWLK